MITKEEALNYEIASITFLQSIIHRHFFGYFMRRFERKYKRYQEFNKMYDRTGEFLVKYFTK